MTAPPLTKVAFTDDQGDVETLWAFDLGDGRYKLDSTPWYQYGVSYQDIVLAVDRDGQLHFDRVIIKSGYRTLRVRSNNAVPQSLLDSVVALGCKYEGANPAFVGIDVPANVELSTAADLLIASGLEWEYADPTYEQIYGPEA
ncbi:DUF4265 domain-containing protein [Agrilutibacter solisilvae]|uniref:DUF4265 domain-containing protein n=1 Tax=Agrilutibacter solisilvae TaxID=2763317 RepID=A0A974Y0X1_9GAMM|nr:DUF4265 domain-containing protein [Lysobacter solisilvae]